MNFSELAQKRQSCRKFDKDKNVPDEEINKIISSAVLAPSACNSQPYHITIAKGNTAKKSCKSYYGNGDE